MKLSRIVASVGAVFAIVILVIIARGFNNIDDFYIRSKNVQTGTNVKEQLETEESNDRKATPEPKIEEPKIEGKHRRFEGLRQRQQLIKAIEQARKTRLFQQQSTQDIDSDDEKASQAKFKESVKEAIHIIESDVRDCYKKQLEDTPDLQGSLVVLFEYESEPDLGGVVKTAEIMDRSDEALRLNTELTNCIIETLYLLELPEPEQGGTTTVAYPYYLMPDM